jgi:hypothetical protein
MNREEIIRMAREAGFEVYGTDVWITDGWWLEELERFAALVAAHEREACASICFQEGPSIDGELIAEAIRARGEK